MTSKPFRLVVPTTTSAPENNAVEEVNESGRADVGGVGLDTDDLLDLSAPLVEDVAQHAQQHQQSPFQMLSSNVLSKGDWE